jgi:hypothetical protein
MSNFEDVIIFGNTSLSDLFKQIHKNNKDTDKQILDLINIMKPLATANQGAAIQLMPTVKDLIDVNVKNHDQLIKMAGIAQRSANSSNSNELFNPDEVAQLIEEHRIIQDDTKLLISQTKQLEITR